MSGRHAEFNRITRMPTLSRTPASKIDPAVGSSTRASGSQVWKGNSGTSMANPARSSRKIIHLRAAPRAVPAFHGSHFSAASPSVSSGMGNVGRVPRRDPILDEDQRKHADNVSKLPASEDKKKVTAARPAAGRAPQPDQEKKRNQGELEEDVKSTRREAAKSPRAPFREPAGTREHGPGFPRITTKAAIDVIIRSRSARKPKAQAVEPEGKTNVRVPYPLEPVVAAPHERELWAARL